MKELDQIIQAVFVLMIGIILLGALGMSDFASQIGSLSMLLIVVSVIVIIVKLVIKFIDNNLQGSY
jgi:uncharacterized membrane protein